MATSSDHLTGGATDNRSAILWILLSVVTASAMILAVRSASSALGAAEIVFLRAGMVVLGALLVYPINPAFRANLRFTKWRIHVVRGALVGFSTMAGFYSIGQLPLATVTVLFFMAPIFATLLSMLVHKEKVGPRRWAAIGCGFLGAVIILQPGFGTFHPAMLVALLSSFLFALALNLSREVAQADGAIATFMSSAVMTLLVATPFALPVFAMPQDWWVWAMLGTVAATGAIRSVSDIQAYRLGEASVVAPFTYLRLVIVGLAGFLMFDEIPGIATLLGALVIITSTLYIALREARLRQKSKVRA